MLGALSPPEPVEEKNLLNMIYIFFFGTALIQTSGSNFVLCQTTMNDVNNVVRLCKSHSLSDSGLPTLVAGRLWQAQLG